MPSDHDKLTLIHDVRSGRLPHVKPHQVQIAQIEDAQLHFSKMDFTYNPDGTLNAIITEDKEYSFIWTQNGLLSQVRIAEKP